MGVHGLWSLLRPTSQPVTLESLSGKILGVDISMWLHQASKGMRDRHGNALSNAHLIVLFRRICKLLYYGVRPVFVFDGGVPQLKKQTLALRRQLYDEAASGSDQATRKLLSKLLQRSAVAKVLHPKESNNDDKLSLEGVGKIGGSKTTGAERDMFELDPLPQHSESLTKEDDDSDTDVDDVRGVKTQIDSEFSSDDSEGSEWETRANRRHAIDSEYGDLSKIDIESEDFASLPADMKHEILCDLKDLRKKNCWATADQLPKDADDFSKFQMARLMKQNVLSRQLADVRRQLNRGGATGNMENVTINPDDVIDTNRIASEEGAHYVLWKRQQQGDDEDDTLRKRGQSQDFRKLLRDHQRNTDSQEHKFRSTNTNDLFVTAEMIAKTRANSGRIDRRFLILRRDRRQHVLVNSETASTAEKLETMDCDFVPVGTGSAEQFTAMNCDLFRVGVKRKDYNSDDEEEDDQEDEYNLTSVMSSSSKAAIYAEPSVAGPMRVESVMNRTKNLVDIVSAADEAKVCAHRKGLSIDTQVAMDERGRNGISFASVGAGEKGLSTATSVDAPGNSGSVVAGKESSVGKLNNGNHLIAVEESLEDERKVEESNSSDDDDSSFIEVEPFDADNARSETNTSQLPITSVVTSTRPDRKPIADDLGSSSSVAGIPSTSLAAMDDIALYDLTESEALPKNSATSYSLSDNSREVTPISDTATSDVFNRMTRNELLATEQALEGEVEELRQERGRLDRLATSITDQMQIEAQELLRLFGVPYIVSPTEAEAQCAYLDATGQTDGTVTDDSDVWLFGGRRVYRNVFNQSQDVELYSADILLQRLLLDRAAMVNLALLCGSDYTEGIQGVGPVVAMELLAEFPGKGIDILLNFSHWWRDAQNQKKLPNETKVKSRLRKLVVREGFPSAAVVDAYLSPTVDESTEPFHWALPDLDLLRQYAGAKLNWTRSQVDELLLPLMKKINNPIQPMITSFFATDSKTTVKPKSRRVAAVVSRMKVAALQDQDADSDASDGAVNKTTANGKKLVSTGKGKATAGIRVKNSKKKTTTSVKLSSQRPKQDGGGFVTDNSDILRAAQRNEPNLSEDDSSSSDDARKVSMNRGDDFEVSDEILLSIDIEDAIAKANKKSLDQTLF